MVFRNGVALNLLFDADDTLWDSNIHFLEAFEEFVEAVSVAGVEREAVATAVREIELELIQTHGYGRAPYVMALHKAAVKIAAEPYHEPLRRDVERIGRMLLERECPLLPGVGETIRELADRHSLILFTKGQRDEQIRKLERSGLGPYFDRIETPREKDIDAYRRVLSDHGLTAEHTFMIGNSPRSDINPAIRAGLRAAVYIPYPHTWELEDEALDAADVRIVQLASFRELLRVF